MNDTNNFLDNPGIVVGLLLATLVFELLISFFFNLKIRKLSLGKWGIGALYSGFSTFLFALTLLLNAFLATTEDKLWYIFASSFCAALGSVFALLLVRHYEKYYVFLKPFKIRKLTHEEIKKNELKFQEKKKRTEEFEDKITLLKRRKKNKTLEKEDYIEQLNLIKEERKKFLINYKTL